MANKPVQTFENHVRQDPWITSVLVLHLASIITGIVALSIGGVRTASAAIVVGGIACAIGLVLSRRYSTKLQDRIIRLEMRLRLERVLPPDLAVRIGEFQTGQLIALRFASDAELPELSRKVLAEKIEKRSEIKKLIKDWQADWHRV